ncbi:hypothetical protein DXG03_004207 [Asterophora parasitica]|uniref:Uncharacterized protein n=1 Tax=Asterophora parasitica TaxID=117018 RepID=A0A9P7KE99_9AGAR|nr:hypothetical protein DXG03_004207 [Asterophora parasitica]
MRPEHGPHALDPLASVLFAHRPQRDWRWNRASQALMTVYNSSSGDGARTPPTRTTRERVATKASYDERGEADERNGESRSLLAEDVGDRSYMRGLGEKVLMTERPSSPCSEEAPEEDDMEKGVPSEQGVSLGAGEWEMVRVLNWDWR